MALAASVGVRMPGLARSFGLDLGTMLFTLECISSVSIQSDTAPIQSDTSEDENASGKGDFLEISFLDTCLRYATVLMQRIVNERTNCHKHIFCFRIGQFVQYSSETGSYVWEAAFVLLRYLENETYFPHSAFVAGGKRHRVLDLRYRFLT